jgi:hypothetical protein
MSIRFARAFCRLNPVYIKDLLRWTRGDHAPMDLERFLFYIRTKSNIKMRG